MNILINASNLKAGGGLQVADSICRELYRFPQHTFVVVLSSFFSDTSTTLSGFQNVILYIYNVKNSFETLLWGRDRFLDGLVNDNKINAVLTVFGPSRWDPRCVHLCGFAKAFHVIPESPYYSRMSSFELCKNKIGNRIYEYFFQRATKYFFTENPFITERLQILFKKSTVYTVTNYYNQVFDRIDLWKKKDLPSFDGITLLTVSSSYPHKNLEIAADISRCLKLNHPDFNFRFVITIERNQFKSEIDDIEHHFLFIGKVDIAECPALYQQCDIVFQPTLIECFTATYPEAMRMERPIVTTDLEFARGLCGDAACYYSAVDANAAVEAIYHVATKKDYSDMLVAKGKEQLKKYDKYDQRADKLMGILEKIVEEEYS